MTFLLIIVLGFAPAIFWLYIIYRWDRFEPEPIKLVIRTFVLGMLVSIPAYYLETIFDGFFPSVFLGLVLIAPIVEEFLKFSVVRFGIYNNEEFDEPMDGIVYAAAAALGFASVENPLYLFGAYFSQQGPAASPESTAAVDALGGVFLLRAILSVPGHALWSSMWGYALGRAKFMEGAKVKVVVTCGLLAAMVLHGLHNLLAGYAASLAPFGLIILAGLLWIVVRRFGDKALEDSPFKPGLETKQETQNQDYREDLDAWLNEGGQ